MHGGGWRLHAAARLLEQPALGSFRLVVVSCVVPVVVRTRMHR